MLKITTIPQTDQSLRIHLCGQFTREYVEELEQAMFTRALPDQPLALDLSGVTFVDRDAMGAVTGTVRETFALKVPVSS